MFKTFGIRAAEAVNGLVRITDDKKLSALLCPLHDQPVLDWADILKFVHV